MSLVHPNALNLLLTIKNDTYRNNVIIDDIQPEILRYCFSFLGTGSYRYIAGTSCSFRREYLDRSNDKSGIEKMTTTVENIVSSF